MICENQLSGQKRVPAGLPTVVAHDEFGTEVPRPYIGKLLIVRTICCFMAINVATNIIYDICNIVLA